MRGETVLISIWMVITAPINRDMTMTSGMESTPSFDISKKVLEKNVFHRSGMENTLPMNMQYLPKEAKDSEIIIESYLDYGKSNQFFLRYKKELL